MSAASPGLEDVRLQVDRFGGLADGIPHRGVELGAVGEDFDAVVPEHARLTGPLDDVQELFAVGPERRGDAIVDARREQDDQRQPDDKRHADDGPAHRLRDRLQECDREVLEDVGRTQHGARSPSRRARDAAIGEHVAVGGGSTAGSSNARVAPDALAERRHVGVRQQRADEARNDHKHLALSVDAREGEEMLAPGSLVASAWYAPRWNTSRSARRQRSSVIVA